MDEAIKQARAAREAAADFFSANPGQQYLCMGGAVHTSDGRMLLSPEMTAAEAHRIAQERGQGLYVTQAGEVVCADSTVPGAVRVRVMRSSQTPQQPEPTAAPCPPEPPDKL